MLISTTAVVNPNPNICSMTKKLKHLKTWEEEPSFHFLPLICLQKKKRRRTQKCIEYLADVRPRIHTFLSFLILKKYSYHILLIVFDSSKECFFALAFFVYISPLIRPCNDIRHMTTNYCLTKSM